ncbi:hypothetical protein BC936DRAFT_137403 [Jimgerdemannia flammicorona]|uniref:STI1/HOP DP domain-containing protein n=1 Tax=Jimgerdemannia flammicorona TaxID=994334 RepID=A0A433CXG7_9FUNG|nr:hypothetical protein BC936DRAFT_137403 [Jimgerdemannia flammicorona]
MSIDAKQANDEKELGNNFYKKRMFDTALEHYNKAWELDNTNITILTNKAAVLFEQENYDECIKTCETAIEVGREHRCDYKLISRYVPFCERKAERKRLLTKIHVPRSTRTQRAYGRIGNAHLKLDHLDEAIKAYEKSLTEHRTSEILTKLRETEKLKAQRAKEAYYDPALADKARELGNELYKNNDWPGAVQQYTEAIKRNDKDHRSYSNRAACYLKLLALNEALKDAQKCIELDPSFVRGYTRKASIEIARKEYDSALETLTEGLERDADGKHKREIQELMTKCYQAMTVPDSSQGGSREEILKRAKENPEVQRILGDPVMQQILQQMEQDPKAAQEYVSYLHSLTMFWKNRAVATNLSHFSMAHHHVTQASQEPQDRFQHPQARLRRCAEDRVEEEWSRGLDAAGTNMM